MSHDLGADMRSGRLYGRSIASHGVWADNCLFTQVPGANEHDHQADLLTAATTIPPMPAIPSKTWSQEVMERRFSMDRDTGEGDSTVSLSVEAAWPSITHDFGPYQISQPQRITAMNTGYRPPQGAQYPMGSTTIAPYVTDAASNVGFDFDAVFADSHEVGADAFGSGDFDGHATGHTTGATTRVAQANPSARPDDSLGEEAAYEFGQEPDQTLYRSRRPSTPPLLKVPFDMDGYSRLLWPSEAFPSQVPAAGLDDRSGVPPLSGIVGRRGLGGFASWRTGIVSGDNATQKKNDDAPRARHLEDQRAAPSHRETGAEDKTGPNPSLPGSVPPLPTKSVRERRKLKPRTTQTRVNGRTKKSTAAESTEGGKLRVIPIRGSDQSWYHCCNCGFRDRLKDRLTDRLSKSEIASTPYACSYRCAVQLWTDTGTPLGEIKRPCVGVCARDHLDGSKRGHGMSGVTWRTCANHNRWHRTQEKRRRRDELRIKEESGLQAGAMGKEDTDANRASSIPPS